MEIPKKRIENLKERITIRISSKTKNQIDQIKKNGVDHQELLRIMLEQGLTRISQEKIFLTN